MDSGVDPDAPPMDGRIEWFKSYLPGGSQSPNDPSGHGTAVAEILGGLAKGTIPASASPPDGEPFPGGVATDAGLYFEQVCGTDNSSSCALSSTNYQDFVTQHVRIINQSLGQGDTKTLFTGPDDPSIPKVQAIFQPAVDAGILSVWAAGSGGASQPWDEAGLPYWISSFQPDWLAVVDVAIDADGKPSGLDQDPSQPSNACGVAAEWCLGAPGDVKFPAGSGNYASGNGVGTSPATAIVSGVAAQVLEAFPWMTAANLSDTILTTATPLGSGPFPNATTGWGLVNAARAVHGPAQFAFPEFGPFSADIPEGVSATFSNDISGPGGLKLTGPGTLVLTGDDTWQGGSEIAAGVLTVNGSLTSDVTIDAGGILNGTGTIAADVTNDGTLASLGSVDSKAGKGLTISGNLDTGKHGITSIALGDPLTVGGTASLDGTVNVLAAPSSYTVQSTETLLTAGKVSGTFANLSFASGVFYTGSLSYTPTQVKVALTQADVQTTASVALPMATRVTRVSASNLEGALDVSNQWLADGQTAGHAAWFSDAGRFLAAPDAALATTSLNSLSGEIYATSRAVEAEQSFAADAAVANREVALAHEDQPGVWVQALGASGALARDGYASARYRASGVMGGVDGRLGDFAAGIAAGRTHSNAQMAALGGWLDGRENLAAVYGRWGASEGWYVAARVSYASIKNEVNRNLLLGVSMLPLMGGRTDHLTLSTVEGGKVVALGQDLTLTPYLALGNLHFSQGGFTERGSSMGLTAPSQTHGARFGTLGLRLGRGFDWSLGHSWLQGYLAWRRVFSGANLAMTASFNGVPASTFDAEGQNLPGNLGIVGASLDTKVGGHWSWYLDADYHAGSEGAHQAEADVGVRVSF